MSLTQTVKRKGGGEGAGAGTAFEAAAAAMARFREDFRRIIFSLLFSSGHTFFHK